MFAKSPLLALALLILSASVLEASEFRDEHELRTGVPYYLGPAIWAIGEIGGGVVPAIIGNGRCPSGVKFAREIVPGVPITLSTSPYDSGESVAIDENTEVYISFNASVCEQRKTWGYRHAGPLPSEVILELTTLARIYVRPSFRIRKAGRFYAISSLRDGINYFLISTEDRRLALSSEGGFPIPYMFSEAKDYQEDMIIKSVV